MMSSKTETSHLKYLILLNYRSPHAYLVAVRLGRAAAVTVCGRGGRHLVAARLLCSPPCSRFCGNCRVRDHRRPARSVARTCERCTTTNCTADLRRTETKWSQGSILFWEMAVSKTRQGNYLLTVWLSSLKSPKSPYFKKGRWKYHIKQTFQTVFIPLEPPNHFPTTSCTRFTVETQVLATFLRILNDRFMQLCCTFARLNSTYRLQSCFRGETKCHLVMVHEAPGFLWRSCWSTPI